MNALVCHWQFNEVKKGKKESVHGTDTNSFNIKGMKSSVLN